MRTWLITLGEPLPLPGHHNRPHRTGLLARSLQTRDHEVIWWTSTFDHASKRQLADRDTDVKVGANFRLKLLRSPGYPRNVSLRRLHDHRVMGRRFTEMTLSEAPPDVILCSFPALELAAAATAYGRERGVPVVLDIRDLWPDAMVRLAPRWGRWAARLMLEPLYRLARSCCAHATAIAGITPEFVDWGLRMARRTATRYDRAFTFGYSAVRPPEDALDEATRLWAERGITKKSNEFIACFFGAFGRQFELETVIEAARSLAMERGFRFVLCGSGDRLSHYRELARDLPNVVFPGWVGEAEIWTLLRIASAGLAPYYSTPDFTASIPNKPAEYMSAGLPVVSSLAGSLEVLLQANDCGVTYANGDVQGLVGALRALRADEGYHERLSKNALRLYSERFVADAVYGEMAEYLEEVAAQRSGAPT